jgi:uncharacterized protein YndB with AHSA1/START domain
MAASSQRRSVPQSDDFRASLGIDAPAEAVQQTLTSLARVRRWWNNPVSGSAADGGLLRFGFDESDDYCSVVVALRNHGTVDWAVLEDTGYGGEWVDTVIRFRVRPIDAGHCELTLLHEGLTPALKCFDDCSKGWVLYLQAIARVATSPID